MSQELIFSICSSSVCGGTRRPSHGWQLYLCEHIHLEIVEDESSHSFIQALQRLSCHYAWRSTDISDSGGGFVGAQHEFKYLYLKGCK